MRGRGTVRRLAPVLLIACWAAVATAPAQAADPGRWVETPRSTVPLYYYQGVASDPQRSLFFNGVYTGLYRTDVQLHETARNDDVIPPAVHVAEQYNHIGDIAWDAREGGRVLLPLECYYPQAAPGEKDPNNTCKTGSIGVADPQTLQWRYYVKLDPAEIPKAMWIAPSPDGTLAWTQVGKDLLAYDMNDISAAHAAPAAAPIKAVKRLAGAVPPSGITGAAFFQGRFYAAGGDDPAHFQIWSIDLDTGARQLEIERKIVGESEGIDFFEGLGGSLHWLIQPYNTSGPPTFGPSNGTVLNFVQKGDPRAGAQGGGGSGTGSSGRGSGRAHLSILPRRVRVGKRTRLRFRVSARVDGRRRPVARAVIRFARRKVVAGASGRAGMTVRLRRAGRYRGRAAGPGVAPGTGSLRALRRRR